MQDVKALGRSYVGWECKRTQRGRKSEAGCEKIEEKKKVISIQSKNVSSWENYLAPHLNMEATDIKFLDWALACFDDKHFPYIEFQTGST